MAPYVQGILHETSCSGSREGAARVVQCQLSNCVRQVRSIMHSDERSRGDPLLPLDKSALPLLQSLFMPIVQLQCCLTGGSDGWQFT